MASTRHPAKFTNSILKNIQDLLGELLADARVLDPFAGTGKIHRLPLHTVGVEIEPEWAAITPGTIVADALVLPFADETFDAIATSPTYGNRMADHHEAKDKSIRNTYRHTLGRPLHPRNSGQFQWGDTYRAFHTLVWLESMRVLKRGGLFVVNCKDHIRRGERQRVTRWHYDTLLEMGLWQVSASPVPTPGMRFGENSELRVDAEWILVFRKV